MMTRDRASSIFPPPIASERDPTHGGNLPHCDRDRDRRHAARRRSQTTSDPAGTALGLKARTRGYADTGVNAFIFVKAHRRAATLDGILRIPQPSVSGTACGPVSARGSCAASEGGAAWGRGGVGYDPSAASLLGIGVPTVKRWWESTGIVRQCGERHPCSMISTDRWRGFSGVSGALRCVRAASLRRPGR